jgi:aminopeptidase N
LLDLPIAGILRTVAVNGVPTAIRQVNGHACVPRPPGRTVSSWTNAGDASLNRNDDFLYTIFVPARAHLAFPCSTSRIQGALVAGA